MCIRDISRQDAPLADVDLKVWDGNTIVYSTSYFGGTDPLTTEQGKTPDSILVIYRVYNGSSVGSDNVTQMKIRFGDWFKSDQSLLDEYEQFDFDVPVFRITNQNTDVEYNYIQRAIDNATAGDWIFLSGLGGQNYKENIVVDKDIHLEGADYASPNICGRWCDEEGSGSPPLYNNSLPGITVTADNAWIQDIRVSGFDTGIKIDNASGVVLNAVKVLSSSSGVDGEGVGVGIDVVGSEDVSIFGAYVSHSWSDNVRVDSLSHNITIQGINSRYSNGAGIVIASDGAFINNSMIELNNLNGCHISGADATISQTWIYDNGMNGIYLNGVIFSNHSQQ